LSRLDLSPDRQLALKPFQVRYLSQQRSLNASRQIGRSAPKAAVSKTAREYSPRRACLAILAEPSGPTNALIGSGRSLDIVFGENSETVAAQSLRNALREMGISGTLYPGYPVLSTADAKVFIDGLLLSNAHGLIAFDLSSPLGSRPSPEHLAELAERQNPSMPP
jgi:hypothetical protein